MLRTRQSEDGDAAKLRTFWLGIVIAGLSLIVHADPVNVSVSYFEIPVADLQRARRFYETVFMTKLELAEIDGYEMALFPEVPPESGISGALAKGDVYRPGKRGPVLYFATDDIDGLLHRVTALHGTVLYAKKAIDGGFVAEFEDSEGNRIALFQKTASTPPDF